jgi:hypothetical protein
MRPRPTLSDYVVIAISPALIMALIGSLVFFLVELFYQGQYEARLQYVFALFVFAAVLIGRISIEEGRERALVFSVVLAVAVLLVMGKFVQFSGIFDRLSWVINVGLVVLILWCADKLTWDCTVIDEQEDASGEGLLQTAGMDEAPEDKGAASPEPEAASGRDEAARATESQGGLWQRFVAARRRKHAPGVWVLYFSMAALPIFGIGQGFIFSQDQDGRRYVFKLLVVYVAAALGLLLTTSFLGLRRYLRQRRLEMPVQMAGAWLGVGLVMIVAVLLFCTLLPRRNAEYSITDLPAFAQSPDNLKPNRWGPFNDGPEEDDAQRQVARDDAEKQSAKPGKQKGDNKDGKEQSSEQGDKSKQQSEGKGKQQGGKGKEQSGKSKQQSGKDKQGAKGQEQGGKGKEQGGKQKESGGKEKSKDGSSGDKSKSKQGSDEKGKKSDKQGQQNNSDDRSQQEKKDSEQQKSDAESKSRETEQKSERESKQGKSKRPSESKFNPSRIADSLGAGLGSLMKLIYWALVILIVGYFLWRYWDQVRDAVRNFIKALRGFWARLFGGTVEEHEELEAEAIDTAPPPRPFSDFQDPFQTGLAARMPLEDLVKYSFEAFEAWARERGLSRGLEQTPHEFAQQVVHSGAGVSEDAVRLAELYNRAAYSKDNLPAASTKHLQQLWQQLGSGVLI